MKSWKTQMKILRIWPLFKRVFLFSPPGAGNNKKNKQKENSNDENWMENWTWKIENMVNFPRKMEQQQSKCWEILSRMLPRKFSYREIALFVFTHAVLPSLRRLT